MRGTLALFVRSLRQDARHFASHLLRGGIALIVLILLWSVIDEGPMLGAPGRYVFMSIMWVNYVFISVAAIGYFATSITEEKEEQSLGLLRMAGISPLSLLLGKSVSRLWLAIVLIAIQFPFTLLSVTLGGVTRRQILATYIALAAYTFLLSGIATLCSVMSSRSVRAVVYMVVASILLAFLPMFADLIDDAANRYASIPAAESIASLTQWLRELSVTTRLLSVTSVTFADPVFEEHFWASLVAGSVAFLIAWLVFDFFTNRHIDQSPSRLVRGLLRSHMIRAGRAWEAAIAWRDFHFLAGGRFGWFIRVVLLAVSTAAIAQLVLYADGRLSAEDVGGICVGVACLFAFAEATVQSARVLSEEQAGRTLPLLAMLPQSYARTLFSKTLGCAVGFAPQVILFCVGITLAPDDTGRFLEDVTRSPQNLFQFSYTLVLCVMFLHLITLLSTFIKWGAIPVAVGVLIAFNICCIVAVNPSSSNTVAAMFFLLSVVGLVLTGVIQGLLLDRFRTLIGR